MGVRAAGLFDELGIKMITGVDGSIDEVILKLEKNELKGRESLCTPGAGKGYGIEKDECDHSHDKWVLIYTEIVHWCNILIYINTGAKYIFD